MDKEDRWIWKEGEEFGYTVKSAYLRLREDGVGENGTVCKNFWKSKVVPTALVMTWRVLENKLATKANLERREIIVASSTCSLCGVEEETNTHLFFECIFAWLLWNHCYAWLGVLSVFHNVPLLNFSQFTPDSVNEIWGVVWIAVVNEVWKHRNMVIFNRGVVDVLEAFALVQLKAWS